MTVPESVSFPGTATGTSARCVPRAQPMNSAPYPHAQCEYDTARSVSFPPGTRAVAPPPVACLPAPSALASIRLLCPKSPARPLVIPTKKSSKHGQRNKEANFSTGFPGSGSADSLVPPPLSRDALFLSATTTLATSARSKTSSASQGTPSPPFSRPCP